MNEIQIMTKIVRVSNRYSDGKVKGTIYVTDDLLNDYLNKKVLVKIYEV